MPKQINTYRFGQALVQKFGLKGRFQPVLDETIVPVTVLDDTVESRPAIAGGNVAAVVGEASYFRLENPSNTNVNLVVEYFQTNSGAGSTLLIDVWGRAIVLGSKTAAVSQFRDTSINGNPVGLSFDGTDNGVFGSSYKEIVSSAASTKVKFSEPLIITPGKAINFHLGNDNIAISAWGLVWREETIIASLR